MSCAAFSSHWPTSSRFTSSASIEEMSLAGYRGGQRRHNLTLCFEPLSVDDQDVYRERHRPKGSQGPLLQHVAVLDEVRDDDQQVVIAVLTGVASGARAVEVHPLRLQ